MNMNDKQFDFIKYSSHTLIVIHTLIRQGKPWAALKDGRFFFSLVDNAVITFTILSSALRPANDFPIKCFDVVVVMVGTRGGGDAKNFHIFAGERMKKKMRSKTDISFDRW